MNALDPIDPHAILERAAEDYWGEPHKVIGDAEALARLVIYLRELAERAKNRNWLNDLEALHREVLRLTGGAPSPPDQPGYRFEPWRPKGGAS